MNRATGFSLAGMLRRLTLDAGRTRTRRNRCDADCSLCAAQIDHTRVEHDAYTRDARRRARRAPLTATLAERMRDRTADAWASLPRNGASADERAPRAWSGEGGAR